VIYFCMCARACANSDCWLWCCYSQLSTCAFSSAKEAQNQSQAIHWTNWCSCMYRSYLGRAVCLWKKTFLLDKCFVHISHVKWFWVLLHIYVNKPVGDRFARSYLYATSMFLCLNIRPWNYFRRIPTYVITVPNRYRRTTCNLITALCASITR